MTSLRTLSCQIRPVELIHERDSACSDVIKMLKAQASSPVLTPIPAVKCYSFVRTVGFLETYFGEEVSQWPEPLQKIRVEE